MRLLLIGFSILSFLISGVWWYASMYTLDGSATLFQRQRMFFYVFLIIGIVLLYIGIFVCRKRK